jgi:hypothetical protein
MQRRFWDLFIASFVALFFEMLLVRWLPTTIYYLGYYKNCILFSTFLGFGCGLATRRAADRMLAYFAPFLAAAVLGASIIEQYARIIPPENGEFLWPQAKGVAIDMPMVLLLAIVFTAGALLMVPLGRLVGRYLEAFPPITAYSINIAASLLGVAAFLVISYLRFGPVVWFTIAILPILYLVRTNQRALLWNIVGLVAVVGVMILFRSGEELWSPYSKIDLTPAHPLINARELFTNNNGHQVMYDLSEKRLANQYNDPEGFWHLAQAHVYIYGSAYEIVRPRSVLIVGGGTGNEAASAVRHGVERVDVVEIDPVIISIGRALHPEQPYMSGRVRIINDDARHYMATTTERYDLIIVGFLDSTSHLSSMSNIRLDNYVYTIESFKQARALLNPGGVLQVTYYAVANFVRLRIFSMLQTAFEEPPLMTELAEGPRGDVIFFAGPAVSKKSDFVPVGLKLQHDDQQYRALAHSALPVTDDWPYLNVLGRQIGSDYLIGLAAMIAISFLFIQLFVWPSGTSAASSALSWCFFLQGAGFMLLETNTITRMALILGSTWVVTSFAVILVLLAALASNFIVTRFAAPSILPVIGLLAVSILLNYIVDIHYYLALAEPIRTPLAALQVYLPMLGSSLLFGRLFQRSEKSSYDFGMNIFGALFGGMLEYVSLIIGIQAVYLLALILFVAIIPPYRRAVTTVSAMNMLT